MTEFLIRCTDQEPKRDVEVIANGKQLFHAAVKITDDQILNDLTKLLLTAVKEDISIQEEEREKWVR